MKRTLTFIAIIFICFSSLKAQKIDTTVYESCRLLFEENKLDEALNCYLKYDTNSFAVYKSAIIARQLGNKKQYKKSSKKLISKKTRTPQSISYYANLIVADSAKNIEIIVKGLEIYPDDTILLTNKVNYYLKYRDFENADLILDKLLVLTKRNNKTIYFAKGFIYQSLSNKEKSLEAYRKALEIDSLYFDSYFNTASIYYNSAVDLYEIANNELDNDKYLFKKNLADEELKKAIPYLKKASEINPQELSVLESLKSIYYRLKMDEEYEKVIELINAAHM